MEYPVTIDEALHTELAENARVKGQTVDELVARILHIWLSNCETANPSDRPRLEQNSFEMGRPLIDLTKASQALADLEDQEIIEKLRQSE